MDPLDSTYVIPAVPQPTNDSPRASPVDLTTAIPDVPSATSPSQDDPSVCQSINEETFNQAQDMTPPRARTSGSELQCRYKSKTCRVTRDLKKNGKLHNLCRAHRLKANLNQKKLDLKKKRKYLLRQLSQPPPAGGLSPPRPHPGDHHPGGHHPGGHHPGGSLYSPKSPTETLERSTERWGRWGSAPTLSERDYSYLVDCFGNHEDNGDTAVRQPAQKPILMSAANLSAENMNQETFLSSQHGRNSEVVWQRFLQEETAWNNKSHPPSLPHDDEYHARHHEGGHHHESHYDESRHHHITPNFYNRSLDSGHKYPDAETTWSL